MHGCKGCEGSLLHYDGSSHTCIGFLLFTKFWINFFVMKTILSAVCRSLASHNYYCPSSLQDALLATHFLMMQLGAPVNIFLKQSKMKTLP